MGSIRKAYVEELRKERTEIEELKARRDELLAACRIALIALRAQMHEANDYNCQDWPPGAGCEGCVGDEARKQAAHAVAIAIAKAEGEGGQHG